MTERTTEHRPWRRLAFAALLALTAASVATGSGYMPLDSTDTWSEPGTAGWGVKSGTAAVTNTSNALAFELPREGVPNGASLVLARAIGSGVVVTNITFRFRALRVRPSKMWLRLRPMAGDPWYVAVPAPEVGQWMSVAVPVRYAEGWTLGAERPEPRFESDMQNLAGIELYVLRHGDTDAQAYELDDVRFRGYRQAYDADWDMDGMADGWEDEHGLNPDSGEDASEDPDEDGMSNLHERYAGTRPQDRTSVLSMGIGFRDAPGDIETLGEGDAVDVWWSSVSGRTYRLWRSTNLFNGFAPLRSGIEASPDRNVYQDDSATGPGPYFYRIEVE